MTSSFLEMKLLLITLLLATQCQCNLLESDTLLKLSDILRAMNLEVICNFYCFDSICCAVRVSLFPKAKGMFIYEFG